MISAKLGLLLLTIIICFSPTEGNSQIVINEICAANSSVFDEDLETPDWIELFNNSPAAINLKNYSITDDSTQPQKWIFPDLILQSHEFIVLYASGKDTYPHFNHWETIVSDHDNFKYTIPDSATSMQWMLPGYNDSTWSTGSGGFGYGDNDDSTIINPPLWSVCLRKQFTVIDTSMMAQAVFSMDYDDGFAAWLNGVEIARCNYGTPNSSIVFNQPADTLHEAQIYLGKQPFALLLSEKTVDSLLHSGDNLLSIQMGNNSNTSPDFSARPFLTMGIKDTNFHYQPVPAWFDTAICRNYHLNFKINKEGETIFLYNENGILCDKASIQPGLEEILSEGRIPDGAPVWCALSWQSPGCSNTTAVCCVNQEPAPVVFPPAGKYSGSVTVILSPQTATGQVHYTTNGDNPTPLSAVFTNPIVFDSSVVIKARVFGTTGLCPGPVVTETLLINETEIGLPVISISTDSANLWDNAIGIYTMGYGANSNYPYYGANFWKDWKRHAHVEYFNKQKNKIFETDGQININGNHSRAKEQKSIHFQTNDDTPVGVSLWPDKKQITYFTDFVLRNGGTDYAKSRFSDAAFQRVMKYEDCDYAAYQPVTVFLNGKYWGEYELRELTDEHFLEANQPVSKSQVDILEIEGSLEISEGSDTGFYNMLNTAGSMNPQSDDFWAFVISKIDISNFVDYISCYTYMCNVDWLGNNRNNVKLWRPQKQGARWRFILKDLDMCMKQAADTDFVYKLRFPDQENEISGLFNKLCQNDSFKNYFVNRYADLINTTFQSENFLKVTSEMHDELLPVMYRHIQKFGGNFFAFDNMPEQTVAFNNLRMPLARNQIQNNFSLIGQVQLSLDVAPAGSGKILINSIIPDSLPWKGTYFHGVPVKITALPAFGYRFDKWENNEFIIADDQFSNSLNINFSDSCYIKAFFSPFNSQANLKISEINFNSDPTQDDGDWLEMFNMGSDPADISFFNLYHKYEMPHIRMGAQTIIAPGQHMLFVSDTTKFKTQHPGISFFPEQLPFKLSENDSILLVDYFDKGVIDMSYKSTDGWPDANGNGKTFERKLFISADNKPYAWFDGCIGGSPGKLFDNWCGIEIDSPQVSNEGICVFPNPATGLLHIYISDFEGLGSYKLFNSSGNNLQVGTFTENLFDISVTDPGLYLLWLNYNGRGITIKFINTH